MVPPLKPLPRVTVTRSLVQSPGRNGETRKWRRSLQSGHFRVYLLPNILVNVVLELYSRSAHLPANNAGWQPKRVVVDLAGGAGWQFQQRRILRGVKL